MSNMTKTEVRNIVREIRNNAARIANLRSFTTYSADDPKMTAAITDALNNIDGLSAQLREALTTEDEG